jgi:hypothetical protein
VAANTEIEIADCRNCDEAASVIPSSNSAVDAYIVASALDWGY